MKLSSVKANRSWTLRVLSLMTIMGVLLFFQNCGPTFKTDASGNVLMSSFSDPIIPQDVPPSTIFTSLPQSRKTKSSYQATACTSGQICSTKVYIDKN